MTDITRLINSIKRRTSSARELGYDVLFVALDDLDVLADSLETALRANAARPLTSSSCRTSLTNLQRRMWR
jgi:hypothetical protein